MRKEELFAPQGEKTEARINAYFEKETELKKKRKRDSLEKLDVQDLQPAKKRKLTVQERMKTKQREKAKRSAKVRVQPVQRYRKKS